MGDFFAELRRRHIYRVGAAYVVVAWGITQVLDVLSQIWALPAWIAQPATIVLAIGLPVTLIIAWLIEGKAQDAVASAVRSPATTVDWVLSGAVAVVIGLIGYQQFASDTSDISAATESDNAAVAIADEIVEDVSDVLPNSVAVLPFANLSADPENAFFASGIHDTLLNELAKISAMNVISRTSVLRFADGQTPISQIADELNVETIMEGTVQYADGRVLVTAQLIDPETEVHLWSENYDREFEGIFAIQADIAMNIANALEAEFSITEQENIERLPTESPEAYALFLKAITLEQQGFAGGSAAAVARRLAFQNFLDEALALDPEFALAYARKAGGYLWSRWFTSIPEQNWPDFRSEMDQLIEANANKALEFDPSLAGAHVLLAWSHINNLRGEETRLETERALQLSPNGREALGLYGWFQLLVLDRPEEAIRSAVRVAELDPNDSTSYNQLGRVLHLAGRQDEAIEAYQACLALAPLQNGCTRELATAQFARGDREAALNTLREVELRNSVTSPAFAAHGFGLLGQAEEARQAFEVLREMAAEQYVDPVVWAWAYMGVGDYDEALNLLTTAAENPELIQVSFMAMFLGANIWFDPMLEEPAFVGVRNRLSLRQ